MTAKRMTTALALVALGLVARSSAMALEKPRYEVLDRDGNIELRRYEPYVVAETMSEGEYDQASGEAFRRLFRYISGKNRRQVEADAPKIAMTAPVTMTREGEGWRMAFMVPSRYSLESAPPPADPRVSLRLEPGGMMAALTYSGTWRVERFQARATELGEWIAERGLEASGEPLFAGYDPPFMPWFLRRNEVLIPLASAAAR